MKKLIMAIGSLLILGSCYNDKYDKLYPATTVACDTTTITYTHDILPIITTNCNTSGGCHDADGAITSGYDFSAGIASLQATAASGTLLADINWLPGHNNMPKNGTKLPACDINKITRWVNLGAQNN